MVRERLLCEELAPPPANVNTNIQPPTAAMTTRDRYLQHSENPTCRACHVRIDPIGFAFEHFDSFGRKRDQENGHPIDSTGTLSGMASGDVPLDGIDSLSNYLATSKQVSQCLTRYVSYNAYGVDHCSESAINAELAASDGSVKSIVMAVIHAPQFTTRSAE
jgi:hypothetical protein